MYVCMHESVTAGGSGLLQLLAWLGTEFFDLQDRISRFSLEKDRNIAAMDSLDEDHKQLTI